MNIDVGSKTLTPCYVSWVLGEGMEINTVQTTYIYLRYKLLAW